MKNTKSYSLLNELAANPYDLTVDGALSGRLASMKTSAVGIDYVYGCQRLNEEVVDALRAC